MNLEIIVNEYLLAWYLLYGASLSKEIDKFRKNLYNKYRKEYNFCYKDKSEMIKYGKDYIPDNDLLYNEIFNSDFYPSLKKETNKHKMHLVKILNNDKVIKKCVKDVLKLELKDVYQVNVIHPRMECIEYSSSNEVIIWGSDKDKYDVLTILMRTITKGMINIDTEHKEIVDSIIELAVINEMGRMINKEDAYNDGNPTLKLIKHQIYPFWLMYLGYNTEETIIDRMIEDKIGFDLDKYPIDKNMKKLNLQEFINFCIKNSKHILKLNNVLKIEKEEDIEII